MSLAPFSAHHRAALTQRGGWDPVGQLMRSFFGDTGAVSPMAMAMASAWTPPVDIEETDEAYIIDVDLPSVDPADIDLELRGEELRISGSFEEHERGGVKRRQSRRRGEFAYVVDLPGDVNAERVEAAYVNGVLTVTVGKVGDVQPRRIEIERGTTAESAQRTPGRTAQSGAQQSGAQQPGTQQPGMPQPGTQQAKR